MSDVSQISKLRSAVIQKQEIILNKLTQLPYQEVMKLLASLSSLVINLDMALIEVENKCNKFLVSELERDPRATFSKGEAALKSSEIYMTYRNILSLKQCASRGLGFARMHAQYLLKLKTHNEESEANSDE
ncbi:MAG: hypothetical protein QE271_02130 [Bacteriovoracaceae bacterium]|nr:hypothetical protein [Bacteriovoracaceae bacterium]